MWFTLIVTLILAQAAQPAPDGPTRKSAPERLEFMKKSLKVHTVHSVRDPERVFKLEDEPVLRFTNPVGTVHDGAIFLYTGPDNRPEVAVQIFLHNDKSWIQEFSSLATTRVAGAGAGLRRAVGAHGGEADGTDRRGGPARQRQATGAQG